MLHFISSDTKILGINWNSESDTFFFKLEIPEEECTKRIILSTIARCYDPIGLIAPFILFLKLLMQQLWHLNLDWDVEPPQTICGIWKTICQEWEILSQFRLPRHVGIQSGIPVTLLAFSDASQQGYGAVVYVRVAAESGSSLNDIEVRLVCAKSKLAPVKLVTIPRLELCAALLLSKLVKHVVEIYSTRVLISKIFAFSDSTVVLNWLRMPYVRDVSPFLDGGS